MYRTARVLRFHIQVKYYYFDYYYFDYLILSVCAAGVLDLSSCN
jgi:hypothetical protein